MARQPKRERLDGVDAEHIDLMLDSRGWQLYLERLLKVLAQKQAELEQPADAVKIRELQGGIAMLRLALGVPAILMKEAQKGATENETDNERE